MLGAAMQLDQSSRKQLRRKSKLRSLVHDIIWAKPVLVLSKRRWVLRVHLLQRLLHWVVQFYCSSSPATGNERLHL